jgi:uncharacterized SAM-binding protein YcdF (DUF218 family)
VVIRPRARSLLVALLALLAPSIAAADQPSRALVVFGSAVRADGSPSPSLLRRLRTTLSEARRDLGALIVVSGGSSAGPAEGPFMARWLEERGVDPRRVLVEGRARHTGENADLSAPLLARAGVRSVTVVTERFHVRRASFHMRAALRSLGLGNLELGARAAPDGLRGLRRVGRFLTETAKIARDAALRLRKQPSRAAVTR